MRNFIEIAAPVLFFLNYALAAAAVFLCLALFRQNRKAGWVLLGLAFLTPFFFAFLRVAHGLPFLNYRRIVEGSNGVPQVSYSLDFPGFYLVVAVGLWLLVRDARRGR